MLETCTCYLKQTSTFATRQFQNTTIPWHYMSLRILQKYCKQHFGKRSCEKNIKTTGGTCEKHNLNVYLGSFNAAASWSLDNFEAPLMAIFPTPTSIASLSSCSLLFLSGILPSVSRGSPAAIEGSRS